MSGCKNGKNRKNRENPPMGFLAALSLCSALLCVLLAGPPARAAVIEDWSSGTDANWSHRYDLAAYGLGPTGYTVSNGTYTISTQPLPPLGQQISTGSGYAPPGSNPVDYAHGIFQTKIRMNNNLTVPSMVVRGTDTTGDAYAFSLNQVEGHIGITRQHGATIVSAVTFPYVFTDGIYYDVRADATQDATFGMRIWPDGTPMPPIDQLSFTDPNPPLLVGAPNTGLALFVSNESTAITPTYPGGALSATFGTVEFIPTPEPASLGLLGLGALALLRRRGRC
jgi:hypothetical protein